MKTKRLLIDFIVAFAPSFFIVILPVYLATQFLPSPYNLIACIAILAIAVTILHFRDEIDARRASFHSRRGGRHLSGHRVS